MRSTAVRCAAAALVLLAIGFSAHLQAWGRQGHRLDDARYLPPLRAQTAVADQRLAQAGVRLAAIQNEILIAPPMEW